MLQGIRGEGPQIYALRLASAAISALNNPGKITFFFSHFTFHSREAEWSIHDLCFLL